MRANQTRPPTGPTLAPWALDTYGVVFIHLLRAVRPIIAPFALSCNPAVRLPSFAAWTDLVSGIDDLAHFA